MSRIHQRMLQILWAALAATLTLQAAAQDAWPSRPLRMLVTGAPSSNTYLLARLFADKLAQHLGQPVVVESKAGAGGTIATQALSTSPPDGYTILMLNSAHSANPFLYAKLPYDTLKDFSGVALLAESPYVAFVQPQLGVKNMKELIEYARKNPDAINYPSAGTGSATHLAAANFAAAAKVSMTHVPYKDNSSIVIDFVSGRVQFGFLPVQFLLSQAKEGKLLAFATSSTEPMTQPLVLPTVKEATGLNYSFSTWNGIVVPSKTPAAIVDKLSAALSRIVEEDDVKAQYKTLGVEPHLLVKKDFDAYIKSEMARVGPLLKTTGVQN